MTECFAKFRAPGVSEVCQTWYQVIGDLDDSSKTPLIIIHGGPGAGHEYLRPLNDLSPEIPLVFYDQIGCGRSTHLPDRAGDEKFWCMDLFIQELDNLLDHLKLQQRPIDIYGHSWGGILAASWASRPSPPTRNLRRLVLSSSPASMSGFRADLAMLRMQLPEDVQAVLNHADETKDFMSPEYQDAIEVFYQRHLSLTRPWPPQEVQDMQKCLAMDMSSYLTMYGPNPLVIAGSLRDWTCVPSLHRIKVPTLLLDGSEDTVQDESVRPLFEHIEKVKWVTLDNAGHLAYVDQRVKYMKHLRAFLTA
ncbi:proline-specific peptidase [Annulohypoxylon moriforme]|nr:proline-specific peptidase [Annulohypoxylon moriforme]